MKRCSMYNFQIKSITGKHLTLVRKYFFFFFFFVERIKVWEERQKITIVDSHKNVEGTNDSFALLMGI